MSDDLTKHVAELVAGAVIVALMLGPFYFPVSWAVSMTVILIMGSGLFTTKFVLELKGALAWLFAPVFGALYVGLYWLVLQMM